LLVAGVQCSSRLHYLREDPLRAIPGACTSLLITRRRFRGSHGDVMRQYRCPMGGCKQSPVSSRSRTRYR
jgi:hypothetical protein